MKIFYHRKLTNRLFVSVFLALLLLAGLGRAWGDTVSFTGRIWRSKKIVASPSYCDWLNTKDSALAMLTHDALERQAKINHNQIAINDSLAAWVGRVEKDQYETERANGICVIVLTAVLTFLIFKYWLHIHKRITDAHSGNENN